MIAEVAHLIARDAAPERLRALIRSTISDIENSFTTIDRLQSRTRLALALSLLDRGGQTPRFGRPTASLRAELTGWTSTTATIGSARFTRC
jgi:adenine-specific DNA-methyltransferase